MSDVKSCTQKYTVRTVTALHCSSGIVSQVNQFPPIRPFLHIWLLNVVQTDLGPIGKLWVERNPLPARMQCFWYESPSQWSFLLTPLIKLAKCIRRKNFAAQLCNSTIYYISNDETVVSLWLDEVLLQLLTCVWNWNLPHHDINVTHPKPLSSSRGNRRRTCSVFHPWTLKASALAWF